MSNNSSFSESRPLTVLLILLAAAFLAAVSAPVTSVKVRAGDSISYLAFKHLHRYNQEIVDQIKRLNPHIKDVNLIKVGQTVYLPKRKPSTVTGKRGEPTPSAPPPETRKMAAAASRAVATLVDGEVQMMGAGTNSWQRLQVNAILKTGDKVRVLDQGRLELVLDNRSVLRLAANTTLELKEVERRRQTKNHGFWHYQDDLLGRHPDRSHDGYTQLHVSGAN